MSVSQHARAAAQTLAALMQTNDLNHLEWFKTIAQQAIDDAQSEARRVLPQINESELAHLRRMVRDPSSEVHAKYVGHYADTIRLLLDEIDARDNLLEILQQDHELYHQGASDLRSRIEKVVEACANISGKGTWAGELAQAVERELATFAERPPMPPTKAREEIDRLRGWIERCGRQMHQVSHATMQILIDAALKGEKP